MESWKKVKGYQGLYEVSDRGRVRSLKRSTTSGKTLRPCVSGGYGVVDLSKNGNSRTYLVHRLVASNFLGFPKGKQVNHKDGVKSNNNLSNLEWVSVKENNEHAVKNGLKHKVSIIQFADGNKMREWSSIVFAARALNIWDSSIVKACSGVRKTAGGFSWEYKLKNSKK